MAPRADVTGLEGTALFEEAAFNGLCVFIMVVFSCCAARRIFSSKVSVVVVVGLVGDLAGEADLEETGNGVDR